MLLLQGVSYTHPNKDILLTNLNMVVNDHDKIALIGNNGTGKSTLLQLCAGLLQPTEGLIKTTALPYYVPQHFGQYNHFTIAQALGVADKINALTAILAGNGTEDHFMLLNDDWTIEERCREALQQWQLNTINLQQPLHTLSGGEKTKVFLAGILIHDPLLVLMDEPSNHLDSKARQLLYDHINNTRQTLLVVSHDRTLLNLLSVTHELDKKAITVYGGNYDFYTTQKAITEDALKQELLNKEKELRKAKEVARETIERQQKLDARGRKKQEQSGLPTISLNTFRNNAEKSTARTKDIHTAKTAGLASELDQLRKRQSAAGKIKVGFDPSALHQGKKLIDAADINFKYGERWIWKQPLSFIITCGERIAIQGGNGTGKTTLIKMMLGSILPQAGTLRCADATTLYIDQDYSLINSSLTVYQQALQYNTAHLSEHELKSKLTHFLFTAAYWNRPCAVLSGGEKMRLMLCCLTVSSSKPDIIMLDEPTNNLDIQNVAILTTAINEYNGTLIAVSHDAYFLQQVNVQRTIDL